MNNPLALCELAPRPPNISSRHKVKQAWLPNDRFFVLGFYYWALMQGALSGSNSANRHMKTGLETGHLFGTMQIKDDSFVEK